MILFPSSLHTTRSTTSSCTNVLISSFLLLWIASLIVTVKQIDATKTLTIDDETTTRSSRSSDHPPPPPPHHHHHQNQRITRSSLLFSRPPSPLFQGNGHDYITLFLRLNQNDATREDRNSLLYPPHDDDAADDDDDDDDDDNNDGFLESSTKILPHYELQMEVRSRRDHTTTTTKTTISDYEEYHDEFNGSIKQQQQQDDSPTSSRDREDTTSTIVGSWSNCNVGTIIPSSTQNNHFPTTVTIPNLSSEKTYR